MRKLLVFYLLFLLTFSAALLTQSRQVRITKKERRIALIIGNGAYKSSPLRNPVNDANDTTAVLKERGFDVTLETNADLKTMKTVIREFGNKLKRGGVGLFYYAGHGMQVKGKNYLIPVDSDIKEEDEITYEAVDAGRVLSKMESAGNKMNIIILDACRDNPFARSFRSSESGLARMDAPSGSLIVYATSPGKTAADGKGRNGIFTKHLLKVIKETNLEIGLLLRKVRKNVINETNNIQVPWEASSLTGDFYFVLNVDPDTEQQTPIYKPKLPSSQKVDLSDIEAEAKKNREAKQQERKAWSDWQQEFQTKITKAKQIDKDENVSAGSKKKAWERILNAYNQDNPYSSEDERMRKNVQERVNFWEKKIIVINPTTTFSGIHLRSDYRTVSIDDVSSMLRNKGFYSKKWSWNKDFCNPKGDFNNNFQSRTLNGDKVVIDRATGLMWHQSGSSNSMKFDKAKQWINNLNISGYAGYSDWRLPTLEEGASLLESSKKNGDLYIDPVFSNRQSFIWTGDLFASGLAWIVHFSTGHVIYSILDYTFFFRPVRSGQ